MQVFETDRDAVAVGMLLWEWLAEDPTREKGQWPGWLRNGGTIPECESDCPACEFARAHGGSCGRCPVWSGATNEFCMKKGTPTSYGRWRAASPHQDDTRTERSAIAASIAGLHRRALKRIVEGGE